MPAHGPSYDPASGDGFNVIVDPANAQRAVGEYTDLTAYKTSDGGHSFTTISPSCVGQSIGYGVTRADCDPSARFQAPLAADTTNPNHWVAGGRYVWDTTKGWDTTCDPRTTTCDWKQVFDLGDSNATTAISSGNGVTYAAWVSGGNPSPSFDRGIATNYGGTWHQLTVSSLPNRYIAGVTVDPANGAHAYTVVNGTPGAGSTAPARASCSRPPTAGPPGVTCPATCRMPPATRSWSPAGSWSSPPT